MVGERLLPERQAVVEYVRSSRTVIQRSRIASLRVVEEQQCSGGNGTLGSNKCSSEPYSSERALRPGHGPVVGRQPGMG